MVGRIPIGGAPKTSQHRLCPHAPSSALKNVPGVCPQGTQVPTSISKMLPKTRAHRVRGRARNESCITSDLEELSKRVGGMGEALNNPPRYALACGSGMLGKRPFHHSVKLHCTCKVTVKSLKASSPSRFSNKRCSRLGETLTFNKNACFTSSPEVSALAAVLAPIRSTSIAYADFRIEIRCTSIAFADFRFNVASNPLHRHRIWSLSLHIRCAGIAYADFRFRVASNPLHRHCIWLLLLQVLLRFALKL